ncbi:Ig-like domain-containing protein [bacterium]|nr:Ig-like domain-containing protein [bacterium]
MVLENITIAQDNFCIAPLVGTFATIDTTTATARFIIKNTTGVSTVSYTLNPNLAQNTVVHYFDYIGPRNVTTLVNGMVFITMESNSSSQVTIKKWNLNKTNTRLDLDYTITKNTSGNEIINCTNMAAGRYYTTLSGTTVSGTGKIALNDITNVISGTRLYIGPSSNTSYLNAYEEVIATSISGNTVSIRTPSGLGIPLANYYNTGDPITYLGDFYLFSEVGYGNNTNVGSMITIDNYTGTTITKHDSALYNGLATANYGIPFYGTVGIIKGSELLYVDITDHTIQKSSRLNITRPFSNSLYNVNAIAFSISSIYRLQSGRMSRADNGDYAEISWATYNYHEDGVSRYSDTITLYTTTGTLGNQKTVTIYGCVRDQYGMALSGKTVTFAKIYGDVICTWGEVNKQGVTNINGICSITYTSGWYDPALATNINEDIKISAKTDGANILTGSIYIYTTLIFRLNAKFLFGAANTPFGTNLITQKSNVFTSTNGSLIQALAFNSKFELKSYSKFRLPGGHEIWQDINQGTAILEQRKQFVSNLNVDQRVLLSSLLNVTQSNNYKGACPLSQTYISRHLPSGSNKDDVSIAQFKFIIDAVPTPFSEKNNVNATIWLKLAPYGFDLNKSTLIFRVRELSYAGDSGFIDYVGTANLIITEYDAGGGLIGLEILYTPTEYFHNAAVVYVYLSLYDNGLPPNKIEFDYWFLVIPDYKSPYILNEVPSRNQHDVPVDSEVSFDILDTEVGVDINTLEFYIDNRAKIFTYTILPKGYRITYTNIDHFYYTQPVEISIRVNDSSNQANTLYDMWRFYCVSSEVPFIDPSSFYPVPCVRGLSTRTTEEHFRLYDVGTGIDMSSITLLVDGIKRPIDLTPIIKRIE